VLGEPWCMLGIQRYAILTYWKLNLAVSDNFGSSITGDDGGGRHAFVIREKLAVPNEVVVCTRIYPSS